ncbi:hypothetical protein [Pseudomonas aeruginosa]|uniref:hypothetical protein n=1 Tax=Pseudomonas aeruginosa TaxID=287 RepID=UPI001F09866D|nr:hypothetical protein [Pseudomonas aeruginosa]
MRESAARGLSRRATRLALGIGPWVFREMLTLMPDIEWPAKGQSLDHAGILTARGLAPWPKSYIDQHARPVAVAASLNHKQALRLFGLKLPKPERQASAQHRLALAKEGEA